MFDFAILEEVRRGLSRTGTLDIQRADFVSFWNLVSRVP